MIINLFTIDKSFIPKDHIKYLKIDLDFINNDSVELILPLNISLPHLENQFMKFNEFEYQLYKIPIIKSSSVNNYFILKFIIKLSKKCRCFDNKSSILYQYETTEITSITSEYLNIFIEKALCNIHETGICNNCKNVDCICKVSYIFDKNVFLKFLLNNLIYPFYNLFLKNPFKYYRNYPNNFIFCGTVA